MKKMLLGIFVFACLPFAPSAKAQLPSQIELACPAGTSPLANGTTVNNVTGKFRQNLCVDVFGVVAENHSGSDTFIGTVNFSNPTPGAVDIIWGNARGTRLACSTIPGKFQTIAAAIADLPASGGTIETCPGHTETLTANLIVGTATQNVRILSHTPISLTCNITDTVSSCITIGNGSLLECAPETIGNGASNGGCTIFVAATFNGTTIITNTVGISYFNLAGWTIRGDPASTVSTAVVLVRAVTTNTKLRNLLLFNFPGTGLQIDDSGSTGTAVVEIDHVNVSGNGTANNRPCRLIGNGATSATQSVTWQGGQCQFPGAGFPAIEIDGVAGAGGSRALVFNNLRIEQSNNTPTVAAVSIRDVRAVVWNGGNVTTFNNQGAFNLSQSGAGITDNILIHGTTHLGAPSVASVVNAINSRTYTSNSGSINYLYLQDATARFILDAPLGENAFQEFLEVGNPSGVSGKSVLWAKTTHGFGMNNNNAGVDSVGNMNLATCGTTSTCANTAALNALSRIGGPIALAAGTLTITSLPFTSSTSYVCSADDSTGINGIDVIYNSGSSVTFNGTGTDSIRYECHGN